MRRVRRRGKGLTRGIIIFIVVLGVIYFGMSMYFMNYFYIGTTINGYDVSGKTFLGVSDKIEANINSYTLVLEYRDGVQEEIDQSYINLIYELTYSIEEIKNNQNPFLWINGVFNNNKYTSDIVPKYDENEIKKYMDSLYGFNGQNIINPEDASIAYINGKYEIIEEVKGTKIKEEVLYKEIIEAINNRETSINLEENGCYENPKYTANSNELIELRNELNKYISTNITYTFNEHKESLDKNTINEWIIIEDNFRVYIDEEKIKEYVRNLHMTYEQFCNELDFVTSSGEVVKVTDKENIQSINIDKEVEEIISLIKVGESVSKSPSLSPESIEDNKNLIQTYVEISLEEQKIWFYKNGELLTHGNIVTGNVSQGHTTPEGAFRLKYKQRDTVLRGPGYASPVDYWMPFNGGIGIHDASWRSVFGGEIYKYNGSHGCINTEYSVVEVIFENIEPGDIVICY